jgi:hypothetical protein
VLVKVRKSLKLHDKDREHNSAFCKAVKALRDSEIIKVSTGPQITKDDMTVVDYWTNKFLPWYEEEMQTGSRQKQPRKKASTIKDYDVPPFAVPIRMLVLA